MNKFITSSIAIACASFYSTSHGQQSLDTASKISEIVVTAKGEQSIDELINTAHIFTEQDIAAAQVKSIPALLERVGGIHISDSGGRGSATGVFLRGISSSQTIVLIDGVRVGSATLGAAALNSFPIEAIERIEVLKGPFSGIYGADAVGGVIQLFTKKGEDNQKVITASAGSDGLAEASVSLGFGDTDNSFHISLHAEETDGIDRTSILTGNNDDDDAFEETALSVGGKVTLGDRTHAKINILATENTVEFDNTFGDGTGNQTDNETLSTALAISHRFNDRIVWTTTIGTNEDEAETSSSFPSTFITNRDSIGTEIQLDLGSDSILTAGLDYYEEDIESTTIFPVTERDNTAPSFNFLFFPFFGNPDILPEESDNFEIGLSGAHGSTQWRVNAYQIDVENLFSFDPNTFLAANVGEAELRGIEVAVETQLFDWTLGIQADLLDTEDELSGDQLDDRPERSLSINASRDFGALGVSFDIRSETGRVDRGGESLAGYGLFDIAASYQINDNIEVLANIDNLFDKDYTINLATATDRFNTEGRQFKLSVRYGF